MMRYPLPRLLGASAVLAAALLGACAPAPQVIVLAPTETAAGPVVPTRAPTSASAMAASPTTEFAPPSATPAPTEAPTEALAPATPTVQATVPPTATASPEPSATTPPTLPPSPTAEPPSPTAPPPSPTSAAVAPDQSGMSALLAAAPQIVLGDAVSGEISDTEPVHVYAISASAGDILDLKADAVSGNLLPMLHVLTAEGEELARSLYVGDGSQALLRGVALPTAGEYYLAVSRQDGRGGFNDGQFELVLSAGTAGGQTGAFAHHAEYGSLHTGVIDDATPQLLFTFAGNAGDLVSIQTTATSGDLDSRLELSDGLGQPLARNDDDPSGGTLDAGIYRFVLPADGYFSISAGRYAGSDTAGDVRLKLTLEGNVGPNAPLQAPLEVANSISIRDDGTFITDFRAGDHWLGNGQEARVQSLATFHLPPLPAGAQPTARFILNACTEYGTGFAGLGNLRLFEDRYGQLDVPRDYTRALAGARILADLTSCDPVDVSDAVSRAYAEGRNLIQFRLTFPSTNNNQQTDEIRFDPRLEISAGA